ncbi:hypothetical protein RIVM261_033820 [Rivularia sp. IAM M-261]|nr:hypothetical protein RIVM261_033820 [Rivularia sp. IAM M-261]
MTKVKQKVYLISEQQRDALLNYLLNRPYREVAGGVQFLTNAPTTVLNLEVPEEESIGMQEPEESSVSEEQSSKLEMVPSAPEQYAIFSPA